MAARTSLEYPNQEPGVGGTVGALFEVDEEGPDHVVLGERVFVPQRDCPGKERNFIDDNTIMTTF